MHVAHYPMMCAYVTRRGAIGYYIRCMRGDPVLSVCSINGRERLHAEGPGAEGYVRCTGESLCDRGGIKNYIVI